MKHPALLLTFILPMAVASSEQENTVMDKPAIITFQIQHEAFSFLGIENKVTPDPHQTDFGKIWDNFFKVGGWGKIEPYQKEKHALNVWYYKDNGETLIYHIGKIVENVDTVPGGYSLAKFPACEFLVVTTEWMATHAEAVGDNGNGRCNRYADTVQIPDGYARYDGPGNPFHLVERENFHTGEGSRYEVWVPIKKVDDSKSETKHKDER